MICTTGRAIMIREKNPCGWWLWLAWLILMMIFNMKSKQVFYVHFVLNIDIENITFYSKWLMLYSIKLVMIIVCRVISRYLFWFIWLDVNRDQRLDLNEFRNLLSQSLGATVGGTNESINYSSYDQSSSSFASANTGDVSGFSAEGFQVGAELSAQSVGIASSSSFAANASQQQVQVDPSNPKNLFQDPNPQIIRRPAPGEALTYTQNIRIRFLQPPPVPPPGVSLQKNSFPLLLLS